VQLDGASGDGVVSVRLENVVGQKRKLHFRSARELAEETSAEVEWVAKPWVPAGGLTEIDGKIKAAGKTSFVTLLVGAVIHGRDFLNGPTLRSPVVYLTEQSPPSFREALRRANLLEDEDLSILEWRETIGVPWPDVVAAAGEECQRIGARLLVVDTLAQFAGLLGDAENSSGEALQAVMPLQRVAAEKQIAVVIVRHSRKGGGEVGESARGSSAFAGAVDVVMSIRRREGNAPKTQRVIHALSRFDETPDSLVIDLTDDGYIALGSEDDASHRAAQEQIQRLLEDGWAPTEGELLEVLDSVSRSTLKRVIQDDKTIERTGKGKRGDPFRYQLKNVSVQPLPIDGQKENETPSLLEEVA
jgi:hypothetical protein